MTGWQDNTYQNTSMSSTMRSLTVKRASMSLQRTAPQFLSGQDRQAKTKGCRGNHFGLTSTYTSAELRLSASAISS